MIDIRAEQRTDITGIDDIIQRAFGSSDEVNLVRLLRDAGKSVVSLVAVEDGRVVGHVMFSEVAIDPPHDGFKGVGLAPLAVLPELGARWVGSRLVRDGLELCRLAGYNVAVVLGSERYYPRFGFSRASDFGLGNEYHEVEYFFAMELADGALVGLNGTVRYQPEFSETNC